MKKNAKILLIGFLVLQFSCKTDNSMNELKNNFTKNEIEDLKIITKFFKGQICQNQTNSDFKNCFEQILPELLDNGYQLIINKADFNKQKELYESISKTTFDKLWGFTKLRKGYRENNKQVYKSISISTVGVYMEYLKEFGKRNEYISEYTDGIYTRGAIGGYPTLESDLYLNPNSLDLNDFNIQLIISIHYLTLNDNAQRDEKWN
jgi:hypothetical protein